MKDNEICIFIHEMNKLNDTWIKEQVLDMYGDMSLDEALIDRKKSLYAFSRRILEVLKDE